MNRKQWIHKLRQALKDYPSHVVDEIIDDYNEHFDNGIYMGKSEEEIASELGNPKEVAKEYFGHETVSLWKQIQSIPAMKLIVFIIFIVGLITIFPLAVNVTSSILKGIFLFLLFVILVGVIISVILIFYGKNKFNKGINQIKFVNKTSSNAQPINYSKEFDPYGIEQIIINANIAHNVIKETDVDNIQVRLSGMSDLKLDDVKMVVLNNALEISFLQDIQIRLNNNEGIDLKLEVLIPRGSINRIKAKSNLGNIQIVGSFSDVDAKTRLGKILIEGVQEEVNLDSALGNIYLTHFDGYGSIKSKMGNVVFNDSYYLTSRIEARLKMGSAKSKSVKFNKASDKSFYVDGKNSNKVLSIEVSMGNIEIK